MSSTRRSNDPGTSPHEAEIGYSRVVRVGTVIHLAVTTATHPDGGGDVVGIGDMDLQARQPLENIRPALHGADARLEHVVRTRMFVTELTRWEDARRAHGEVCRDLRPVAAMSGTGALVHPDRLIETEGNAVIHDADE